MMATDAVALYPCINKHETAKKIRQFIEKSDVKFKDINISEALVYLKLNDQTMKKQGSYKEVAGFLPTPKNGKEEHMTHQTVKGPHTAKELKKLDDKSTDKTKNTGTLWSSKKNQKTH